MEALHIFDGLLEYKVSLFTVVVVIIIVIESIMAGNLTHVGQTRNTSTFYSENLKRRCHLKDLGVDGRIILKLILKKYSLRVWTGLIRLTIGISVELL
jgi:hypothetical protein